MLPTLIAFNRYPAMQKFFLYSAVAVVLTISISNLALAQEITSMDELDPFDPRVEETLQEMDRTYYEETGKNPNLDPSSPYEEDCYGFGCTIYVIVKKSEQLLYLYINGSLETVWLVSTGINGRNTPNMDSHPNGRIYDAYASKKFPGGDYRGLGNMPYAVFIQGGFAIHGTTQSNFNKLGTKASHGCIRLHPENAKVFNRLVREYGVKSTWVTVEE